MLSRILSGKNQISAKSLIDGDPVVPMFLTNYINLSIKLDTFPSKCKIAKIKHFYNRKLRLKLKISFKLF